MKTKPKKQDMKVTSWNIRIMLDKANSSRPGRCSGLKAHKLSHLDIDIAALSEVRHTDEDSLHEIGADFTLFWCGKPSTDRHLSGVGFTVRNSIVSKLETSPSYHSDRITSMRLPLTLFSVYAIN